MLQTTLLMAGTAIAQAESASIGEVMEVFAIGFSGVFIVLAILMAGIRVSGLVAARFEKSKENK